MESPHPAPPVDFSQLRAFLFCRRVDPSPVGMTLVDVHDTRFAATFPATFSDLLVYVSFEAMQAGALQCAILWRAPGEEQGNLLTESVLSVEDPPDVARASIPLSGLSFDRPGRYSFALYVQGALIGASALTIGQAPAEEPAP